MPQTQTPTVRRQDGSMLDYIPSSQVYAGDVVLLGNIPAVSPLDIAPNTLGAVACDGVWRMPKDTSVFAAGDKVYWNPTANPVSGTAGTGAASSTATGAKLAGMAVLARLTGDAFVDVLLTPTP